MVTENDRSPLLKARRRTRRAAHMTLHQRAISALLVLCTLSGAAAAQTTPRTEATEPGSAPLELAQAASPEVTFWESVRDSDDPAEIEAYLNAYPNGQFAPLARIRLDKLQQSTSEPTAAKAPEDKQAESTPMASQAAPGTITFRVKIGGDPEAKRGVLGVRMAELSDPLAKSFGLADAKGAFVTEALPNSPAQLSGIRPLDLIVAVDGREIAKMRQLQQLVGAMPPGTEVSVVVRRLANSFTELSGTLRMRAEKGDADAAYSLGWLFANSAGTAKNDAEAVRWYREAADRGQAVAAQWLGWMYENGLGVPKDDAEAVRRYRQAAEKNNADAMTALGRMYQLGAGVSKDETEAVSWYRKGSDQGHSGAMDQLGRMYLGGLGVQQDDAEAVIWFRKAAEDDYADALNALGFMYEQGRGVYKDDAEAVRLFRKAAEQNHAFAFYNLGLMYGKGQGVAKDEAEAARLYRRAAEQGNPEAMYTLGRAYAQGLGVKKDPSAGAEWIFKALKAHDAFSIKEMTTNAEAWSKEFRRELQRHMHEAGVYDGKIDGKFGEGTKSAIEALGKASGSAGTPAQ